MEVKAQAKYIRMSPRKIRLVVDLIRGLDVDKAEFQLSFMNKAAAKPVLKLLKSAVANALQNFKLKKENLYIEEIRVDGGPTLKRWQPRAFGRATPIRKRSAHIIVVLGEKKESKQPQGEKLSEKKEKPEIVQTSEISTKGKGTLEKPKETAKEKKEIPKEYKKTKGFFKKIFVRKAGM
jgi:large subunit ribosomal protein L22